MSEGHGPVRTFRSDNNAGLCPEATSAIVAAAEAGHAIAYGDDDWTSRAVAAVRGVLGEVTEVFLVATGTAANALSIAALTEPWQRVLCHDHSHLNSDESTAPERLAQCRLVPIRTPEGRSRITPEHITAHGRLLRGDVHEPQPGVVSITNPTEFGEVYTPAEVEAMARTAHELGYRVHCDGARFANAVAFLGCDPRDLADRAGVDALSLGGSKNGLPTVEAVCFFAQDDGAGQRNATHRFDHLRKGSGHMVSKHRFLAAPLAAVLEDGAWLRHAGHANAMAARLGEGLAALGCELAYPVQSNGVFVRLGEVVHGRLQAAGYDYYPVGEPGGDLVRLMCSFDTTPGDVDALLEAAS